MLWSALEYSDGFADPFLILEISDGILIVASPIRRLYMVNYTNDYESCVTRAEPERLRVLAADIIIVR